MEFLEIYFLIILALCGFFLLMTLFCIAVSFFIKTRRELEEDGKKLERNRFELTDKKCELVAKCIKSIDWVLSDYHETDMEKPDDVKKLAKVEYEELSNCRDLLDEIFD